MLLTLRRVASVEFVAGNITQQPGRFQKKSTAIGEEIVKKSGSAGRGFFRNADAVRLGRRCTLSVVEILGAGRKAPVTKTRGRRNVSQSVALAVA
jgi:hypothetical protein